MKRLIRIVIVVAVLAVILLFLGPFYILPEGQQAIVIRFGQIVQTERDAGLKFKVPVVDNVHRYSKKLLSWDGDPRRMPTAENQFIWVDTTARWRIEDPRLFYQSTTTMERAYSRLDEIIESAVRTIISDNRLSEAVRDSNLINELDRDQVIPGEQDVEEESRLEEITELLTVTEDQPQVNKGRRELSNEMLARTIENSATLGITIEDIVIRQIRYSEDLTESVYNRMVQERQQIASAYRSYGEGRREELIGQMENEQRAILSEAYARAETIRGEADAEAASLYSEAYRQDEDFFAFWRAIESYRTVLPNFNKTLSTDMDYFDFLYGEEGR